jgi:hypothetical protein
MAGMARTKAQTVSAADPLRAKLDQLAELAIDRVLAKGNQATAREITETLKVVSSYRATAAGADAPPPSAWEGYQRAMSGEGNGDGSRH